MPLWATGVAEGLTCSHDTSQQQERLQGSHCGPVAALAAVTAVALETAPQDNAYDMGPVISRVNRMAMTQVSPLSVQALWVPYSQQMCQLNVS